MTNRLRGIKEDARSRRFEDVVRCGKLKHDPEKWVPVFRKRSCSDKSIERDDDSKKSHPALRPAVTIFDQAGEPAAAVNAITRTLPPSPCVS